MEAYFAQAKRSSDAKISREIKQFNEGPVMTWLLCSVNGLLAILDERRQLIAINDSFIEMLGIKQESLFLGFF